MSHDGVRSFSQHHEILKQNYSFKQLNWFKCVFKLNPFFQDIDKSIILNSDILKVFDIKFSHTNRLKDCFYDISQMMTIKLK